MDDQPMTPTQQVAMHERVEDARRVLLARKTEEDYASAVLLSRMRSAINDRLRNGERVGLFDQHRLERACAAVLGSQD